VSVSQTTSHAISESDSRHESSQDLASGEVCMYDCVHLLVGYLSAQDLTAVNTRSELDRTDSVDW